MTKADHEDDRAFTYCTLAVRVGLNINVVNNDQLDRKNPEPDNRGAGQNDSTSDKPRTSPTKHRVEPSLKLVKLVPGTWAWSWPACSWWRRCWSCYRQPSDPGCAAAGEHYWCAHPRPSSRPATWRCGRTLSSLCSTPWRFRRMKRWMRKRSQKWFGWC